MDSEAAGYQLATGTGQYADDYQAALKRIVNEVDRAMAAEGVDAGVRDRVVERLRIGTPGREQLEADIAFIQALADAADAAPDELLTMRKTHTVPPANA